MRRRRGAAFDDDCIKDGFFRRYRKLFRRFRKLQRFFDNRCWRDSFLAATTSLVPLRLGEVVGCWKFVFQDCAIVRVVKSPIPEIPKLVSRLRVRANINGSISSFIPHRFWRMNFFGNMVLKNTAENLVSIKRGWRHFPEDFVRSLASTFVWEHVVNFASLDHRFGPKRVRKIRLNHHRPRRIFEGPI
jgi:hypothetical protein